MYTHTKDKKGFTLVELLVVISIISFLASIVLSSLSAARTKARDAKRIQDMAQVQTALEAFNSQYGIYPVTCGAQPTWSANWQCLATCLETGSGCGIATPGFTPLMSKTPQDPLNTGPTDPSLNTYFWGQQPACGTGRSYKIGTVLETNSPVLQSGIGGSINGGDLRCTGKGYCLGVGTCAGW